ncbi:ATP-dependent Clp protease proteolytic subunit [Okeania hirsuta]
MIQCNTFHLIRNHLTGLAASMGAVLLAAGTKGSVPVLP